jgi:hypothetical protein
LHKKSPTYTLRKYSIDCDLEVGDIWTVVNAEADKQTQKNVKLSLPLGVNFVLKGGLWPPGVKTILSSKEHVCKVHSLLGLAAGVNVGMNAHPYGSKFSPRGQVHP